MYSIEKLGYKASGKFFVRVEKEGKEITNKFYYYPDKYELVYKLSSEWDYPKKDIIHDLRKESDKLNKVSLGVISIKGPKGIDIKLDEDLFEKPFDHKQTVNNVSNVKPKVVKLNKDLRDYQTKAVDFAIKNRHSIIELPTGKGKTIVAISLIKKLSAKEKKKVIVLVPTMALLDQWVKDGFKDASVDATSVFSRSKDWTQFTVITYQSAFRHLENLPQFDIIIFDEVHHLFAPKYLDILRMLVSHGSDKKYLIGLTATRREAGEGVYIQNKYFPAVFSMSLRDFQKGKTKIPISVVDVPVSLTAVEKEKYSDYARKIAMASRLGSIVQWVKFAGSDDESKSNLAKMGIKAYARQKRLLSETPDKIPKIAKIIKSNEGQFIVFNDTIRGMKLLNEHLQDLGIKSAVINQKTSTQERREILDKIKRKKLKVLIGGNAISEGLDIPDLSNIVFSSLLVKSTRNYVQRLGRVLRPVAGKKVKVFIVYAKNTIEQANALIVYDVLGEEK